MACTLNLLGCGLPRTLLKADPTNPAGHWEPQGIVTLNDEILASSGSAWDDWSALDETWYASPVAQGFRERARAILENEFADSRLFVLKDPRICRLLPLWVGIVRTFGVSPFIVSPIRNPLDVALSLEKRNGIDLSIRHLIWLRHVLDAERASRALRRAYHGVQEGKYASIDPESDAADNAKSQKLPNCYRSYSMRIMYQAIPVVSPEPVSLFGEAEEVGGVGAFAVGERGQAIAVDPAIQEGNHPARAPSPAGSRPGRAAGARSRRAPRSPSRATAGSSRPAGTLDMRAPVEEHARRLDVAPCARPFESGHALLVRASMSAPSSSCGGQWQRRRRSWRLRETRALILCYSFLTLRCGWKGSRACTGKRTGADLAKGGLAAFRFGKSS